MFWVNKLEKNEKFQEYVQNDINSLSILTVPEMISYVKGREAEYKGDPVAAVGFYMESINYYDANERYESLSKKSYEEKYQQAKELANNNDLDGAYQLFAEIEGYSDSSQRMEYIAQILGYIPTEGTAGNKTDADSSVSFSIISVKPSDLGKVEIEWEGGTNPVTVAVYHYFNDNHNEGVLHSYAIEGWEQDPEDGAGTVSGFIPGQRYWIKLTDGTGEIAWQAYSAANESVTVSKMIDDKGMGWKKPTDGVVTTKSLEKECQSDSAAEQTLIEARFQVNRVKYTTIFKFFGALRLPNGDIVPVSDGYQDVICVNGRQSLTMTIPWKDIYTAYEKIPDGKYCYLLGIDNHVYVEHDFWLNVNPPKPRQKPEESEEGDEYDDDDDDDDEYDDDDYDDDDY